MMAVHQILAALTVATQVQKELLLELLSEGQPEGRAQQETRYRKLYAQKLEQHLLDLERDDPAFAARVDYRSLMPPP